MKRVYLFRHGQSTFNKLGKFTGWMNPSLTEFGKKQARIIAKKLRGKKLDLAVHTSLKRSHETLKIVLKYHPECEKFIIDDRMIERNYGDLNGTTHDSFIKKVGKKLYELQVEGDLITALEPKGRKEVEKFLGEKEYDLIHRGFFVPPPNGESFAMVEKRVAEFIKDLKKFKCGNVAISAHGNSIRLFRKIMEKATVEEATKWIIPYDDYFEYTI